MVVEDMITERRFIKDRSIGPMGSDCPSLDRADVQPDVILYCLFFFFRGHSEDSGVTCWSNVYGYVAVDTIGRSSLHLRITCMGPRWRP